MSQRFFCAKTIQSDSQARLEGDEAKHLSKVLRKKPGEEVLLFDGSGREFRCRIEGIAKDAVDMEILETREIVTETPFPIRLAVALPKGDRQKWMIEKLTELGCDELIPLVTEFSVAKADAGVIERLRRQVVEASKQCGRLTLMRIAEETSIAKLSEKCNGMTPEPMRLILHPKSDEECGQKSIEEFLRETVSRQQPAPPCYVLIGPEGGFESGEVHAAIKLGWQPLDLGPRILRVETAAMTICALLSHAVSDSV